jgi:hypothetical protein
MFKTKMIQNNKLKKGVKVRIQSRSEGIFEGNVKYWNPDTSDLTIEPGFYRKKNPKYKILIYF